MLDRYSTITMYTDFNFNLYLQSAKLPLLAELDRNRAERMRNALLTRGGPCLTREEIHLHGRGRHTPPLLRHEPVRKARHSLTY